MFTLDQVVPWGRSFDEYRRMFALTEAELRLRILGCGDGPASFNAEATRRGAHVASHFPFRMASTSCPAESAQVSQGIAAESGMSPRPCRSIQAESAAAKSRPCDPEK